MAGNGFRVLGFKQLATNNQQQVSSWRLADSGRQLNPKPKTLNLIIGNGFGVYGLGGGVSNNQQPTTS